MKTACVVFDVATSSIFTRFTGQNQVAWTLKKSWTELAQLKQEGKVRYIGVSNFNVVEMQRAAAIAPITSLQPPYSMLARATLTRQSSPSPSAITSVVIVYSPMSPFRFCWAAEMTRQRIRSLAAEDWRLQNPNFREASSSPKTSA